MQDLLKEAGLKLGDANDEKILKERVIDLGRLVTAAEDAAKKATTQGDSDLASKLTARAEELKVLMDSAHIDTLDPTDDAEDNSPLKDDSKKDGSEEGKQDEAGQSDKKDDDTNKDGVNTTDNESQDNKDDKSNSDADKDDSSDNSDTNSKDDESEDDEEDGSGSEDEEDNSDEGSNGSDNSDEEEPENEEEDEGSGSSNSEEEEEEEGQEDSDNDNSNSEADNEEDEDSSEEDSNTENDGTANGEDEEDSEEEQDEENSKGQGTSEESDEDSEGGEGDEEEDSDRVVKDIFADEEDIPSLPNFGIPQNQEAEDPTIHDIIKQLSKLSGEAKEGAIEALEELLKTKSVGSTQQESLKLTEAINKSLRDMSDDAFADLVNDTLELIDRVNPTVKPDTSPEERKGKVQQIKTDQNLQKELDFENRQEADAEKRAMIKAKEIETRAAIQHSMADFQVDFYDAIKDQVETAYSTISTYQAINPFYDGEPTIVKGEKEIELPEEIVPIINVYYDQSSSWSARDTTAGNKALASIAEFVERGEIKLNILYFGDRVSQTRSGTGSGTSGWSDILANVRATGANNVVIMTDSDMQIYYDRGYTKDTSTVTVDGCVWWIWKNGKNAPFCVQHLRGRGGNYQYSFNTDDLVDD